MPVRVPFRRRALRGVAAAAAAALLLSGCAAASDTTSGQSEVVWAIEGANLSAGHMDPQTSQLDVSAMVQRVVLDSLVFQQPDGSFSPWLATQWSVAEDGLSYTFQLREDVSFTDGEPFTAEAVKANFDRIADPETASAQAASMLGGEYYAGTEAVDDFTVRVNFTQPYAPFLQAASTSNLGFYSPKVLKDHADQLKAGGPDVTVGTGPFVLSQYTPDEELVYTRNDDYAWGPNGAGAAAFDTLRVAIVPEPSVRVGVLNSGEADAATQLPPNVVSDLGQQLNVVSLEYPGLPYSLFLNEKYGVFADQKVRQAFSRAIEIDAAVEQIFSGQFPRAWSILGSRTAGYDPSIEGTWTFDRDAANSLLDDAGWTTRDAEGYRVKDGKRLTARWISYTPVTDERAALANAIQSNLREVGFEIVREELEPAAYNEQYVPKRYDITDWGFSGADPDLLRSHLHTDGFQNASQVSDPAVDALLEEGVTTTDTAARDEIYAQLQQFNADHVAIVPLYVPSLITAVSPEITGLRFDVYGRPLWATATVG